MSSPGPKVALPPRYSSPQPLATRGSTFLVDDEVSGRKAVVKRLLLGRDSTTWKEVELFEREGQTLATLDHRGVPRLLEIVDEGEDGRLLVMEFVAGKTLAQANRSGTRMGRQDMLDLAVELLDVLQYLHELAPPVVHRDIEPQNIVLGDDGRVVLVDFGSVAKAPKGETTVGTFGYMAPEQLYGEARPQSDLYALAMTLLAVATGSEPEDLPRRGLTPVVPVDALGERLAALVSRMVEPDPDDRPSSAAEAKAILSEPPTLPVLAPSTPAVPGREAIVAAEQGTVGWMIRRAIRSPFGMSAIEWAVVVSIPVAAVAGALGLYWAMAGVPVALAAAALLWRRRRTRRQRPMQ